MLDKARAVRIFVSSPGDAQQERMRVERVVERLNGEFSGVVRLHAIRWEREFYKARDTFQAQIPEAADCDVVIAILRHRLGTELPPEFPPMPSGEPYPSGTAYEVLTAMEAGKQKGLPDLYVFRYPELPTVRLDEVEVFKTQWERLESFFKRWFLTPEGHFKAAFHEFRSTDHFEEQVEDLLRKWLDEMVVKGRTVMWPIATRGSPFRGLSAFGSRHSSVFFGRSRDTARALDALKEAADKGTRFLLVVGPSGSGKSSLVQAGLVPRLTAPGVVPGVDVWRVASLRPSEAAEGPVAALARRLFDGPDDLDKDDDGRPCALPELTQGDYATPADLAGLLALADDAAAMPISAALDKVAKAERRTGGFDRPVRADLVLMVDQLDELFASDVAEDERRRFARLLSILVATGRVWVIATLRADLYEPFQRERALLDLKMGGATYDLAAPGPAELAEIVRGPAQAAELVYETDVETGQSLDERLLADADRPDMLPLLQFALDQLFQRRTTSQGETQLTFAAYRSFAGIDGAIDMAGEQAVSSVSKAELAALPRLLRSLVRHAQDGDAPGRGGNLTLRSVPLTELESDPPVLALARALAAHRIVVMSTDALGANVRLAHQRILKSWSRASQAVRENADFYRILDDVKSQMRRWTESAGHPSTLLPHGQPLRDGRDLVRQYRREMQSGVRHFIEASQWRRRFVAVSKWVVPMFLLLAIILAVTEELNVIRNDVNELELSFYLCIPTWAVVSIVCLAKYGQKLSELRKGLVASGPDKSLADGKLLDSLRLRRKFVRSNALFLTLYLVGQIVVAYLAHLLQMDEGSILALGAMINGPILIIWIVTAVFLVVKMQAVARSATRAQARRLIA